VVKPVEQLTKDEIIAYCKEKLAPYKVPKDIEFIDTLPKSAIGKILRKEVRELEKKKREQIA
jgi:long-chain acyl-CoA synthetase